MYKQVLSEAEYQEAREKWGSAFRVGMGAESIKELLENIDLEKEYTELNRCVTRREYEKVLDYAFELGIENGFFQDGETARESFIPAFDYEGVRKMP